MKHSKILSAILALTVTASLVGCSGDSGIVPNSSGTTSQNTSGTAGTSGSGALTPNDPATSGNTSSDATTSSSSSDVNNDSGSNSDTSSPSSGNDGSDFVMPSIDELLFNLPVEFKGPDKAPAAGTPGAETPKALDFVRAVGANIENAGSFVLTGEIEGTLSNKPTTEKYVFVVDKNTSYLRIAHEEEANEEYRRPYLGDAYEEYRVLNGDGTITVIYKDGDKWVGLKSVEKLRGLSTDDDLIARDEYILTALKEGRLFGSYDEVIRYTDYGCRGSDLYSNAIATFGPITLFNSQFPEKTLSGEKPSIVGNMFGPAPEVERDNDGNLTFSFMPNLGLETTIGGRNGVNFMQYPSSNMLRYFPATRTECFKGLFDKMTAYGLNIGTKPIFTVSNDNILMKVEGHVGGSDDVDYVFNFSNWGNVAKINVPEYTLDANRAGYISKQLFVPKSN